MRLLAAPVQSSCARPPSSACEHGTFIAAMLMAGRGAAAPGICPGCTLIVRSLFEGGADERDGARHRPPAVGAEALAAAISDTVAAGADILNLSLAVLGARPKGERDLRLALDDAARSGVVVVAAGGNQGTVGGSVVTAHPWVISVAASDRLGRVLGISNIGSSIGRRGLCAPGVGISSLHPEGRPVISGGTSVSAAFVTGAAALLWSALPDAAAAEVRRALLSPHVGRRPGVVPPLLDARRAHDFLWRAHRPAGGR